MPTADTRHKYQQRLYGEARYWLSLGAAMLAYSTVLYYSYKDLVSPRYGYLPFHEPSWGHYWAAFALTVGIALVLPRQIRRASDMAQWLLFLTAQAPMVLLVQYMDRMTPDQGFVFGLEIAACTVLIRAMVAWTPRPPSLRRPNLRNGAPSPWAFLMVGALVVYVLIAGTIGIPTRWVPITDVYDVRAEYAAALTPVPFVGYLVPTLTNAINPALIAYGIYSMRWQFLALGVGGQMFIYLTNGSKVVFFSSVALIAVAVLYRLGLRMRGTRLFWAVSAACVLVFALDHAMDSYLWTDMFIRRFVIIPGGLAIIWADTFMNNGLPHGHFADTPVIGSLIATDPFPRGVSYFVGQSLTGNPFTQANVSIFGNGYYQAAFIGMLVESALLALILVAFDWATKGIPTPAASLLVFMPTIVLSATGVFTAVTSHGLLAAIIVAAVLPSTGWGRRRVSRRPSTRPGEPAATGTRPEQVSLRGREAG